MQPNYKTKNRKLLVIICISSIPFFVFLLQYIFFRYQEELSIQKFDEQNLSTLSVIGLPVFAEEISRKSTGIDQTPFIHGRKLYIDYLISNVSLAEILQFYDNRLLTNNWKKSYQLSYEGKPASSTYYSDTGCITVDLNNLAQKKSDTYTLKIWHDYFSQTFSPNYPWWFGWQDRDKTLSVWEILTMDDSFITCPAK